MNIATRVGKSIPQMILASSAASSGDRFGATRLAQELGFERERIVTALGDMEHRGDLTRVAAGLYIIPQSHWIFKLKWTPNPPKVFGERCYMRDGERL